MNNAGLPVITTIVFVSIVLFRPLAIGQSFQDQPAIKNSSGAQTDAQGTIVDAAKYSPSGGDICKSIRATWIYSMGLGITSPTIDARSFTGAPTCTNTLAAPVIPLNARGRVLLGNVWVATANPIVVPAGVEVIGLGVSGANQDYYGTISSPVNTVIAPSSSAFSGAVLSMGTSGSCGGYTCPQTGVKIKSLSVDCLGYQHCSGIENTLAGEGSTVEDVTVSNAPVNGVHVTVGNPSSGPSATHSGPYRNITIQYLPGGCASYCNNVSTNGVVVDCSTALTACPYVVEFDNITADATSPVGGPPTPAAIGFYTLGVPTLLTNSHIENYQQSSIQIGNSSVPTSGVRVEDLSFNSGGGVMIGGMSSNVTLVDLSTSATATIIDNFYPIRGTHDQTITGQFLGYYFHGACANVNSCTDGSGHYLYSLLTTDGFVTNNLQWQAPNGWTK